MVKKTLIALIILIAQLCKAQLVGTTYTFTQGAGTFTALGTATISIYGPSVDEVATNSIIPIGFNFNYACNSYSSIVVSPNGWLSLNTSYSTAITSAAGLYNNDLDNASGNFSNANIIAPCWNNIATTASGKITYTTTGLAGNQILKVEYAHMTMNPTGAPTNRDLTFQVWLYENGGTIEFWYAATGATINGVTVNGTGSGNDGASIGIMGSVTGDYISVTPVPTCSLAGVVALTGATASTTLENDLNKCSIRTRKFTFTSISCTTPTVGTGVASPSVSCSNFTTNLNVTGGVGGCGINYQWYQSLTGGASFTVLSPTLTVPAYTAAVTSATPSIFKCVVTCVAGPTSATTTAFTASVGIGGAGLGSFSVTPTYSVSATTCNFGNELFASGTGSLTSVCTNTAFYTGADVVYAFTPTSTLSIYNASLTVASGTMAMHLYKGCPTSTAGICIASSNTVMAAGASSVALIPVTTSCTATGGVDVTNSNTYYLIIDGVGTSTTCGTYTVNMAASVPTTTFACNLNYTTASITPTITAIVGNTVTKTTNALSGLINLPFSFCFDGRPYNQIYISDNSTIIFPAVFCNPNLTATSGGASTYAAAAAATGTLISAPAPVNNTSVPRNAILAPWQDLNPTSIATASIQTLTTGTFSNSTQVFTISYTNCPMTGCASGTLNTTVQIILYETSNIIDIHVKNKQVCMANNSGLAIMGLHNYDGSRYLAPLSSTTLNASNTWTMVNQAFRFTPTCATSSACTLAALPINFKSFDGDKIDNINTLFWSTAMEENMDYFVIERSLDAQYFEEIAIIEAKNIGSDYIYKDFTNDNSQINYYRLRAVEKDLKYTYTKIIAIGTENGAVISVHPIYPNPTNTIFNIPIDSRKQGDATIVVSDIFGKTVLRQQNNLKLGPNLFSLEVEHLAKGIYYIEIQNTINEVITKQKLVIN